MFYEQIVQVRKWRCKKGKQVITAMWAKCFHWNDPIGEIAIWGYRKQEWMLIIFISSVEELRISYNKFYHTTQNFIAAFANQVSLRFKNIYTYEFLVCVGTISHLENRTLNLLIWFLKWLLFEFIGGGIKHNSFIAYP